MIKSYRDFEVYQRAYKISLEIHMLSLKFPKIEQYGGLADQLRRATKSISMNIAEGYGKHSSSALEFKRYLSISLGSKNEVDVQLQYCKDLSYITADEYSKYYNEYQEIGKMLYTLIQVWK